jgi:spermidine synthase
MARAWQTLEFSETNDGRLELRHRGGPDFLITLDGRVLMNSHANRSELALSELALSELGGRAAPRVLIGGLGMGCTLRAALDRLPADARVAVSELNPEILAWCRGPLAALNARATHDPRVEVAIEDVATRIANNTNAFDAILLDLDEGPHAATDATLDPFYGRRALARTRDALAAPGVFAVWSAQRDERFEERLRAEGFAVERRRPGRGGLRHAVTRARKAAR